MYTVYVCSNAMPYSMARCAQCTVHFRHMYIKCFYQKHMCTVHVLYSTRSTGTMTRLLLINKTIDYCQCQLILEKSPHDLSPLTTSIQISTNSTPLPSELEYMKSIRKTTTRNHPMHTTTYTHHSVPQGCTDHHSCIVSAFKEPWVRQSQERPAHC